MKITGHATNFLHFSQTDAGNAIEADVYLTGLTGLVVPKDHLVGWHMLIILILAGTFVSNGSIGLLATKKAIIPPKRRRRHFAIFLALNVIIVVLSAAAIVADAVALVEIRDPSHKYTDTYEAEQRQALIHSLGVAMYSVCLLFGSVAAALACTNVCTCERRQAHLTSSRPSFFDSERNLFSIPATKPVVPKRRKNVTAVDIIRISKPPPYDTRQSETVDATSTGISQKSDAPILPASSNLRNSARFPSAPSLSSGTYSEGITGSRRASDESTAEFIFDGTLLKDPGLTDH